MTRQLQEADFILCVASSTYKRRFQDQEQADIGLGVGWEAGLIRRLLYTKKLHNKRIFPIFFQSSNKEHIPLELQGYDFYDLSKASSYESLLRKILNRPEFIEPNSGQAPELPSQSTAPLFSRPEISTPESPKVAEPQIAASKLPDGAANLIGREQELELVDNALAEPGTHILEFIAWGGVGKSALVYDWMSRQAAEDWKGIARYFDWSFYSQGTRDQSAASADTFIAEALVFFGDSDPRLGSAHDRGNRLAELVAQQPTILILDGLEPLQYGAGPMRGHLKDPAMLALLKALAQRPLRGLCLITSRETLVELSGFHHKTVTNYSLQHLSKKAGAALLHQTGATYRGAAKIEPNNKELQKASKEVEGHALSLSLLGSYLKLAHQGNIDRRDRVHFEKADQSIQGGHAFRVMAAYEAWLQADLPTSSGGDPKHGPRLLALLRLLGLFDRPASNDLLAALCQPPIINDLTEQLVGLDEEEWNILVQGLVDLRLVTNDNESLDAHPLLREYFAVQLKLNYSAAWQQGHQRLYEYLCNSTEHQPDTLEGLQPLYQAVAHGCLAGLHQQVKDDIYIERILRGTDSGDFYSTNKLGAFGADLGAVACFFDQPWSQLSSRLSPPYQAWLLNEAAFRLRSLGRLNEALQPMRAGLKMHIKQENWKQAAKTASNLSELELMLGKLTEAITDAEQSVSFADRSEDDFQRMSKRTTQAKSQPTYPRLYSLQGFRYCDLFLARVVQATWQQQLDVIPKNEAEQDYFKICEQITERTRETLGWVTPQNWLLDIALDNLTLGRAAFYQGLVSQEFDQGQPTAAKAQLASKHLIAAMNGLRKAGTTHHLPKCLLSLAWLQHLQGNSTEAIASLNEAWEIAERGPMPLYQSDILLTRVRLFACLKNPAPYPWKSSAQQDLNQARALIEKHGYHRRDQELNDTQAAFKKHPGNTVTSEM